MTHPHGPECTCMLDGPDYPELPAVDNRYEILLEQNKRIIEENIRLRALLDQNNLIYYAPTSVMKKPRTRSLGKIESQNLPHIPKELQLKILEYALICKDPIIDPLYKPRLQHLSNAEKAKRKEIHLSFLLTCRTFHAEGLRLFIANNEFIFTQVAALEKFAQLPVESRSTINRVTLRIVGRYYDNVARKQSLLGYHYHPDIPNWKSQIHARPPGAEMDKGIHAYCYQQFTDFLEALQIPKAKGRGIERLLPSLNTMRIDLVNFCDHLWHPNRDFSTVIRWHTGPIVEELIITGVPEDDPEEGVESLINRLVKDEGVFSSGPPIFVSNSQSLKSLKKLGLATRVVRPRIEQPKSERDTVVVHPEGGKPPKSFYPPGRTIWKYTLERLSDKKKKWMEFDRKTGYPVDEVDMWSDIDDSDMYDSDGNIVGHEDDSIRTSDDEMLGIVF